MRARQHIAVHNRPASALALGLAMLFACATDASAQQSRAPPTTAISPIASDPARTGDDSFEIDPILRTGAQCGASSGSRVFAANATYCPFAEHSAGLNISQRIDLPDGRIVTRLGVARGSDGALSLDRQMLRSQPAIARETSLLTFAAETHLFDGRVQLGSEIGWSRSWERDIAGAPLLPMPANELNGVSQRHTILLKPIDTGALQWTLSGKLSRTSDDFRTANIFQIGNFLMGRGAEDEVSSRFRSGRLRLSGRLASARTDYSSRLTRKVSVAYGGVGIALSQRDGETFPQPGGFITRSRSTGRQVSLDLDLFELAPIAAMSDSGLSQVLPKQLSISLDRRVTERPDSLLRPFDRRETIDLFGMWTTPLGDTVIDVSRDRLLDRSGQIISRGQQLLVSHSAQVRRWTVSLDLLAMRTRGLAGDEDNNAYYNFGLSRRIAGGAAIKFEFGRDAQSFGGAASDFALNDKSQRVKLELDLSQVVQKRFSTPSMHLTLGLQLRLSNSSYELRYLDEVIDSGSEGFARQGALVSFGFAF